MGAKGLTGKEVLRLSFFYLGIEQKFVARIKNLLFSLCTRKTRTKQNHNLISRSGSVYVGRVSWTVCILGKFSDFSLFVQKLTLEIYTEEFYRPFCHPPLPLLSFEDLNFTSEIVLGVYESASASCFRVRDDPTPATESSGPCSATRRTPDTSRAERWDVPSRAPSWRTSAPLLGRRDG